MVLDLLEFFWNSECNLTYISGTVGIILFHTRIFYGCITFWIKCAKWWIIFEYHPNPISEEWKCYRNSKMLYLNTKVHKILFWMVLYDVCSQREQKCVSASCHLSAVIWFWNNDLFVLEDDIQFTKRYLGINRLFAYYTNLNCWWLVVFDKVREG